MLVRASQRLQFRRYLITVSLYLSLTFLSVETAKDDVYKFLHSASLHDALQNASTQGIPNFSKYPRIGEICKQVLSAESFRAPYKLFEKDPTDVDACIKV